MAGYDSFEYKISEAARKLGMEIDKAVAQINAAKAELEKKIAEAKK